MLVPEALPARFHLAVVVPGRLGAACLASYGSLLSLETKKPPRATGEAVGARRAGARRGQEQDRGRGADLLHVGRIVAAPRAHVNSTPSWRRLRGQTSRCSLRTATLVARSAGVPSKTM